MELQDRELIELLYQELNRKKIKLETVAISLNVAPETISRWRKRGVLSRNSRNAIALWLAAQGINLQETQPPPCYLPVCPAQNPADRQLQILLENWSSLTLEERGELSTKALIFATRHLTD